MITESDQLAENKTIILRCVAYKKNGQYYNILNLETSVVSQGASYEEARGNLEKALEAYFDAASDVIRQGKRLEMCPVPLYPLRKYMFDLRYFVKRLVVGGNGTFGKQVDVPPTIGAKVEMRLI